MTSISVFVRPLAALTAVAALAQSTSARGAPPAEKTAAEMLDAEGTALLQQRRYAEACPKLAESERLEPGTGVLLRLGLCDEQLGRTASAWSAFREAAARAQRAGDEALRQLATKRADELAPHVPRVVLALPASVPGAIREPFTLICDGASLDLSAAGAEIPMDPGSHVVEAARAGHAVFRRAFVLGPRDLTVTIAIELPAEESVAPSPAAPSDRARTQRTVALVVGGVGVAGVVVGSIFGLAAMSNWNRARSECTSGFSGCSQDALNLQSTVSTDATWSTIGFGVGAVGLVGAVLLWLTAPRRDTTAGRPTVGLRPAMDPNGLGLTVVGTF